MYNLMDYVKQGAGIVAFAIVVNTSDGLVHIVHAADAKCSPAAEEAFKKEVSRTKSKLPKDDFYAATRGLDYQRKNGRVTIAGYNLAQHLRDCGYKK